MFKKLFNYFFKNIAEEQTIVKNYFWITLSRFLSSAFRAILVILSFRILGPEFQGSFYLAMNFILIISIIPEFGIVPIFIRELSKKEKKEREIIGSFLSTFFVLFIISLPLIFLGKELLIKDDLAKKIITILTLFIFFDIFREILFSLFRAQEKMELQALSFSLTNLFILIFGIYFLFTYRNPLHLAFAYLLGSFLGFLITFSLLKEKLIFNYFKFFNYKKSLEILNQSWPIGIAGFIFLLITYIDTLILGHFKTTYDVGIYNSVVKINEFIYAIPTALAMAIFPKVVKKIKENEEVLKIINFAFNFALLFSLPMLFGIFFLSKDLIYFLYGEKYFDANLALKLISFSIPFNFLFLILVDTLIALDKRKELLKFDILVLLINFILNLIFVPIFSYFASSFITSFSSFLSFIFGFYLIKKYLHIKISLNFLNYLISSSLMIIFVSSLPLHFVLKVFVGILFYFLYLWLLDDKTLKEILKPLQ
jgi:O-antigen/teichoic acid export membrane protein